MQSQVDKVLWLMSTKGRNFEQAMDEVAAEDNSSYWKNPRVKDYNFGGDTDKTGFTYDATHRKEAN